MNGGQQDSHEFWQRMINLMEKSCCRTLYKLFEHDITSVLVCLNCHKSSEIHHKFREHVINFRGHSTIQSAWDDNLAQTLIDDYLCNACYSTTASKRYYLTSFPKCLHLVLNRFGKDRKIVDDIGLNNQLKVSKYDNDSNEEFGYYKLVSIVNHIGTSRFSGHYTSSSVYNENCIEFDDVQVRNMRTVVGFNAYMLIYQLSTEVNLCTITRFPVAHTHNFSCCK